MAAVPDTETPHAPIPGIDTVAPAELEALAAQVRRLTEATVKTEVDAQVIRAVTADLERTARCLEQRMRDGSPRRDPETIRRNGLPFHYNPVLGTANPYAPPVDVEIVDGAVHGTANLNHAYEGPPGFVHGGILSLILDQTLGLANLVAGRPGMTLGLNIRYLRPTPLDTDLEVHSVHDRVDGKNIVSIGTISVAGTATVTAEGIFRAVPDAKGRRYFKDYFDRG